MKAKLPIIILLSLLILNGYSQDKKPVKSKLDEATVFFQGAELVHSASVALTKGENEIFIDGISPVIDKNSLKIKATNGVVISSSQFSVDFLSANKESSPAIRKLEDSISYYEKKLEGIKTDISITDNLIQLLQKGTDKNVSGSEKGLGIDELVKTMDYYKTKALELQITQNTNNKNKKACDEAVARLKKQLGQESLKNNKTSGVLRLTLSAPVAATCNFTISYFTPAAKWAPYYDINVESTDKPILIMSKSKVSQTTGLDWEKVKLTLSSATPSKGNVAPLFNAWFIDFYKPQTRARSSVIDGVSLQNSFSYEQTAPPPILSMKEEKKADMVESEVSSLPLILVDGEEVDSDYLADLDPEDIKDFRMLQDASETGVYGARGKNGVILVTLKSSMDDFVTQSQNDLNMVYNIDIPYSIPGNGKEQNIDLQRKETTAEYKYYCAPKLDTETYLLAEISNWEKLQLLSGTANITYDGTYVGDTYIDANSTHRKLTLTLGTDKRVSVKREKLQDLSSTKLLGGDKQMFAYKLTVRNNRDKPVKMVLKDQYPISMQKSIEVELLEKSTTPWTANVESLGVITWEEEIGSGQSKVYEISYSVKSPKGSQLNF
ncbi:MAG: DUF4139 domain-containing protein [Prevotella sp.]|jgi:TonB-dependent SusC/RagA subfamily outer membrane receptor|nr:DUF4139 domain-containing protein [Prevotella sp.]